MFRAHVLETCRGMKLKLVVKQILCIKLLKYWDKYTEMHGQQNFKIGTVGLVLLMMFIVGNSGVLLGVQYWNISFRYTLWIP